MNRTSFYKITFAALLCILCGAAFAQTGEVWKKRVARIIDMAPKEDNAAHHLTDAKPDTSILEMIAPALKSGKITTYSSFDNNFTTKLTQAEINQILGAKIDTIFITDPTSGKEEVKIVHRDFDYSSIHKYRVLEEWVFNPSTGKTDIQITGIAPIRDIYGDDGVFRGVQAMFWIHYSDLRGVITKYEQYHPDNTIALHIWNDYFLNDVKPGEKK